jgi:hypothetical protein
MNFWLKNLLTNPWAFIVYAIILAICFAVWDSDKSNIPALVFGIVFALAAGVTLVRMLAYSESKS